MRIPPPLFFLTLLLPSTLRSQTSDCEVWVQFGPHLHHSTIQGSLRVERPDDIKIHHDSHITENLIVRGTPSIHTHASADVGPITSEGGPAHPECGKITIEKESSLGGIVTHAKPQAFPQVETPNPPSGNRKLHLKNSSDNPGDFTTIRDLKLNHKYGTLVLPPGRYHHITLERKAVIQLGTAGGQSPDLYELSSLHLDNYANLEILGPVELRLKKSFNPRGVIGNETHPEWLNLSISHGGLHLFRTTLAKETPFSKR